MAPLTTTCRPLRAPWLVGVSAMLLGCGSSDRGPAAPTATVEVDAVVPPRPPPAAVVAMLAEISASRLKADVVRLAGFGTRHTLSDAASATRGIGAARRWIKAELEKASSIEVGFDSHRVEPDGRRIPRPVDVVNVVAVLPGAMPEAAGRRYYVVAHYDSRRSDPLDAEGDSPGANDDASGTALVIELARVLSARRHDATLVFMATAGEEQGLVGARRHARAARAAGAEIRAVLSNDIVGDPTSPSGAVHRGRVRLFSEGIPAGASPEALAEIRKLAGESDSASRQLARAVVDVAAWHRLDVQPMLVLRHDRFLRGGDHLAFADEGFPAVRFTVVDEHHTRQHQDVRTEGGVAYGDLPEHVDGEYLAGVARLNGAALMHLANAPSAPRDARVITAALAHDTLLRWTAAPEPDVAGYEVMWRETTNASWQHARDVGDVTEVTLPLNKDNWFFGVRAYDREGYRSPAAFPRTAER